MNRRVKLITVALSLLVGASILSLSIWEAKAGGGSQSLVERMSRQMSRWIGGNEAANSTAPAASAIPLVPTVTATKADSLLTDVNSNAKADPGDTLKYTVTIGASGMDATGVAFNDTPDANTMLVPGSVMTTPLALNDSFTASGNIQITIAAPGVLSNDTDPDGVGPALTITAGTITSANSGNVTLNANGGFTYNPAPGFEGTDTFTYTLNDGEGNTDTATVSFTVSGMIWFVNNSLGVNGDGRLSAPFNSLANFVAGAADDPGDNIFIFTGGANYGGPITLLNNQKLIGQGATASLSSITGITPPAGSLSLPATGGARPTVAHSANNLTLGSGNTLRGFNLSNTGGTALTGSSFGALTVSEVSVTNTNGTGINLNTGTPNASFTSVNTSGGGNGVILQNWSSGSFTITGSGGSCTAATPTCTGGTIASTTGANTGSTTPTGAGIALNGVTNISLSNVRVRDHSNYGIRGNNVTGFTLTNSLIDATAPGFNGDDPAFEDGSVYFTGLFGVSSISGSDIRRGLENLLLVNNASGTLTLDILNSNFQDTSLSLAPLVGNAGIHMVSRVSATMTVNVSNTNVKNVLSDCVLGRAEDSGTLNLTVTGGSLLDSDQAFDLGVSQNGDMTYDINGVTMTGHTQNTIQVIIAEVSSLSNVTGTIRNNTIGSAAVVESGSELGFGINMDLRGNGASNQTIHNNVISHTDREGILIVSRGESSTAIKTGAHAMRITNNTINAPDDNSAFPFFDINGIEFETNNGQTFCLNMSGNESRGAGNCSSPACDGYRLRQRNQGAASVFQIQGLTPASGATAAQVEAHVEGQNPGTIAPVDTSTVQAASGTTIVAYTAGTCTTPAPAMALVDDTTFLTAQTAPEPGEFVAPPRFVKTSGDLLATDGEGAWPGLAGLSDVDLNYIRQAAIVRLAAAGVPGNEVARLANLSFQISDLPEGVLATASSAGVRIDANAAGHGWYIDLAPDDDEEFPLSSGRELRVRTSNPALRQMDLLTVVMREMLHVIGQEKEWSLNYMDTLMSRTLATGVRRLPSVRPEKIGKLTRPGGGPGVNRASSAPGAGASQTASTRAMLERRMRPIFSAFPSPVAYSRPNPSFNAAVAPAVAMMPVAVSVGTLPAGKSITITFNVTINDPFPASICQVSNQGSVSGSNFATVLTNTVTRTVETPPTITAAAPLSRQQGSAASTLQIATVNDCNQTENTLTVTATPLTGSGVTIGSPSVDAAGNVTASVSASCAATNSTFTLTVTDSTSKTATATLTVNATANTPPTLGTYPATSVATGGSTTVTPSAAPTDNGTVSTLTASAPGFGGTLSGNPATGVITVTGATPGGVYTVTVTATDNCGATSTATFQLTVNTAPTITGATISRQQGSPASSSQIATVGDADQAANTLAVTVTPATGSGVTVGSPSIDASGNVTANVSASCTATNSTFTLTVTDAQNATATATLTVNVTANTPPTLGSYPASSVATGGSTTVTPSVAPADNGSVATLTASAPGFTGTLTGNPATGVISVSNANPAGSFTVTVTATDNCGATSTATFTLTVGSAPTIAGATISRQQGSPASSSQIATVSDSDQAANTLAVTVNSGASATVNGVTVSGVSVDAAGAVTASVVASCTATNASFTLTVTDAQNNTATSTLTVNVTANTPPTLGTYPNTPATSGGSTTVTPSVAPSDNGSVASLTASAPGFTGTLAGNPATGVISVTNANPTGSFTVTVTATDNCGATSTATFTLTVNAANSAPTITGATISRQQGSPASSSQIATVSDADQAANTLAVTVNGGASATVNGVTVSGISVNAAGAVTASVVASCAATNASFTLTVTDNQSETATATLTVNVTANTAPTLGSYPASSVAAGGSTTVTPGAAPSDNGTINSLTASAPGFTGTLSVNAAGVVSVSNAGPAGPFTVTVTATDNCGASSTASFSLTVTAANNPPTITGATISRQKGSPASTSQIATVGDANQAANTLAVTVNGSSSATVNGVMVSGISVNAAGAVTASVVASCTATNASFTLTVTDNQLATATATLNVNVTANTAPALGAYPATSVASGGGATVTPNAAPADNGSVVSLTAAAPGFTGTLTGNPATGVITVGNAGPAGTFTVTVTATDNCGATATKTFQLTVAAACNVTVNPATLPQPYIAVPYIRVLSASPSHPAGYTFSVSAGALPPGLNLVTALGVTSIVGIPQTPGTYNFTIKAKRNNSTCEGTRSYTVTIPATVAPILECVQRNQNGSYTARFGYDNSTGAAVTIPVGPNNYFTPGNQNRGQTTVFQPGRVNNAFSVTFNANGNNLAIWFLRGPDGVLRPVNVLKTSIPCP